MPGKPLDPIHRTRLKTTCGDNVRQGLAESGAAQFAALARILTDGGRDPPLGPPRFSTP